MKLLACTTVLVLCSFGAQAQGEMAAKSLFFGSDGSVMSVATTAQGTTAAANAAKSPASATKLAAATKRKPAGLGAGYFIRLKRSDGTTQDVLASRTFQSGERFQLGVKVNKPSYVYIYNQDPSGKLTQLFPQAGQSNYIDAMGVVFLPAQGSFQFDGNPGVEQLGVYVSPRPLTDAGSSLAAAKPDLVSEPVRSAAASGSACSSAPSDGSVAVAMIESKDGMTSKGISYEAGSCGVQTMASKAIVFAEDPNPTGGGQVAAYAVKPQIGANDTLHLQLKLLHR